MTTTLAVAALAVPPAAAGGATGAAAAGAVDPAGGSLQAGYGVSLGDVGRFEQSLVQASGRLEATPAAPAPEAARQAIRPFEHINGEAARIAADAKAASAAERGMSPSDMVGLTVRSTEFMFHCQLLSNIANRTSDGLQQLFRQQS